MSEHPFVHLHLHTGYSFLDGACKIDEAIQAAKACGMTALAITDHNVLCGVPGFAEAARREGIKPIIGCEVDVADAGGGDGHPNATRTTRLVLLAENQIGYRNLLDISTITQTENGDGRPCIGLATLAMRTEGLIALSAWRAGSVLATLMECGLDAARMEIDMVAAVFGKESFFIEIQNHGLEQDDELARQSEYLAGQCGVSVVATNNVHYVRKEHARSHRMLMWCQDAEVRLDDIPLKNGSDQYYLKSGAEMRELLGQAATENAVRIAERCQVDPLKCCEVRFPAFPVPAAEPAALYLRKLVTEGLQARYNLSDPAHPADPGETAIHERAGSELCTIEKAGFVNPMLMLWDCFRFARERNIATGPGRGSLPGSIIAYALGITDVDPIRHGLLSEVFLNPESVALPDIAVEFCQERSKEVLAYIKEKYGPDRVAGYSTFTSFSPRTTAWAVLHAVELKYSICEGLVDLVSPMDTCQPADMWRVVREGLQAITDKLRQADEYRMVLTGLPRSRGTHACGLVLSSEPLVGLMPLCLSNEGELISQYGLKDLRQHGFVPLNVMGWRRPAFNQKVVRRIQENQQRQVLLSAIPADDPATWKMIANADTDGVDSLMGPDMRELLKRAAPGCIEDLAVLLSLFRYDSMAQLEEYVRCRQGHAPVRYAHPVLEPILRESCGLIAYKEQVDRVLVALAGEPVGESGFTLAAADCARRLLAKKKTTEVMEVMLRFVNGCARAGTLTRSESLSCFETIIDAAKICRCKAHAIAYATITYQSAWLKANYPEEFRQETGEVQRHQVGLATSANPARSARFRQTGC